MPRVTAAITTFNRAHFLGDAIRSVLAQTYQDFELLILDNSSRDGTEDVARSFDDPRIRYIRHEAMPISPQRNIALSEARGEFLGFLDDDDTWLPEKLALQVSVFDNHGRDVALVYGGYQFFNEHGVYAFQRPLVRGQVLQDLLWERDGFCASASNPLLRVSVAQKLGGYDPDVKTGEDFHFYLRLSREWLIEFTRELVVSVRQHDGPRLFGASDERIRTEQRVLQEFADVMAPALRARYLKKIGGKHVRMGNGREGRRVLCQAIALSPLDGEAWGQLAVSFLGKKTYTRAHDWVLAAKRRRFLTST